MTWRKLQDLKFIIGTFFALLGAMLGEAYLVTAPATPRRALNLWAGLGMLVFGLFMVALAYLRPSPDGRDQTHEA